MSPYRTAQLPEPLRVEPEKPWFPKIGELVLIHAPDPSTDISRSRHHGKIGYVSLIKENVYMVSFTKCQCRRSVDCCICRSRYRRIDCESARKFADRNEALCALFFLHELQEFKLK